METCVGCGLGDEFQPLTVWRDADGEGWWIHPLCFAVRDLTANLT